MEEVTAVSVFHGNVEIDRRVEELAVDHSALSSGARPDECVAQANEIRVRGSVHDGELSEHAFGLVYRLQDVTNAFESDFFASVVVCSKADT